jgi:outer membrane receptor protein involved in Fe transport
MQSNVLITDSVSQNLWAIFVEDAWHPGKSWTVVMSGRADYHPLTSWQISPRSSLIFSPSPRHVFRVSIGTAFRNPAVTESHLAFPQTLAIKNPFNASIILETRGDLNLNAEKIVQVEASHIGRLGRLKTTTVGFHYRLKDLITPGQVAFVTEALPEILLRIPNINSGVEIRAWGGEISAELSLTNGVDVFANYSYQHLRRVNQTTDSVNTPPDHKFNSGFRTQWRGWTAYLWAHWVDEITWSDVSLDDLNNKGRVLDSYWLLNGRIAHSFSSTLKGFELSLEAFNLADRVHHQLLPARGAGQPGQNGEVIRRRFTGSLLYRF